MIRVGRAQLSVHGGSAARALSLSQRAMQLVAGHTPRQSGHLDRVQVEVRVPRGLADAAIAERIADVLKRRL